MNRARDAERMYRACIAHDPNGQTDAMNARLALMALLAMEERTEEFHALAWETHDLLPDSKRLSVLVMMTRIEYEQTKPDVNAQTLRDYIAADPGDLSARAALAAALDHSGDLSAAREEYARCLAQRPDDATLRERYMDVLYRIGEGELVKSTLAARPDPKRADSRRGTLRHLGIIAESDGDWKAAESIYRRAIHADPYDPEFHHKLSLLLFRQGHKDEGTVEANERARLRKLQDERRRAWDQFADAWDRNPNLIDPTLLLGMARAVEACGANRAAVAWYRQTLLNARDNPVARERLQRLDSLASP
jgi:tetratricopeptide (TPR) repeat protein